MKQRSKPNILILLADQHRASGTRFSGNQDVLTPTLDRMASEGISVSKCVSTHPLCAPFRACLQTGQPGQVNGIMDNKASIRRDLPTLANLFKDQGYKTAYFGKCHWHEPINESLFTPPDWRLGWEYWQGWHNGHEDMDLPAFDEQNQRIHPHRGKFAPEVQTEQFLDWQITTDEPWIAQVNWGPPHNATLSEEDLDKLRETSKRINEELGLGLKEQHFQNPWWWVQSFPQYLVYDVVPQTYLNLFDHKTLSVPANVHPENHLLIQHHLKEYYAQIAALDDLTGRILTELARRNSLDNTIVIYTSDHGDYLGSHCDPEKTCRGKGGPEEESVRVPFLAIGPGLEGGRSLDLPFATIDLLPTLCGLAGFSLGTGFPGDDLSSILQGKMPVKDRQVQMSQNWWQSTYDGKQFVVEY